MWTLLCPFLYVHILKIHLGIYIGVELLGVIVILFNFLKKCHIAFLNVCMSIHFHFQCVKVTVLIHPYQHILLFYFTIFKNNSYPLGYEVASHCDFNLYLPDAKWYSAFFLCLLAICVSSFDKCLFKYFAYFSIVFSSC